YVINGTTRGKACIQVVEKLVISEDCLVLNIWTPNAGNNNTNKSQLKPIMFWIHGGALVFGSINMYNGSFLAAHDVVKENAHKFGGDMDQITIFGESAGSWS
ncbi:unnamed protein product, partial [Medioppia subpectinata]